MSILCFQDSMVYLDARSLNFHLRYLHNLLQSALANSLRMTYCNRRPRVRVHLLFQLTLQKKMKKSKLK